MKRRDFLKLTAPMALSPLVLNGMPARGLMNLFEFNKLLSQTDFDGRRVVIIQMRGGNDFLNTFVPLNQMGEYVSARPTIKIPANQLITLDNSLPDNKQVGLNPSLQKIKNLYDENKVNIVHGVGYDSSNYSHFRSTDLIFGAKDGQFDDPIYNGWVAKYLTAVYPGFLGAPSINYPHPLGIQIGDNAPHIGYGHQTLHNVGVNISGLANTDFYSAMSQPDDSQYEDLLDYVKSIDFAADRYNSAIQSIFNLGQNVYQYENDYLSKQLKVIARLMSGGLESKFFITDMVGFDTHNNQIDRQNSLLSQFSNAVFAFQKDLEQLGLANDTVIITISEFGRKIVENANLGTDHGDLSSWMVIGNGVKKGVTGRNVNISPDILNSAGRTDDVLQNDYRRYLTSVLQDWLGNTDTTLNQIDAGGGESLANYAGELKLNLFKNSYKIAEEDLVDNFDRNDFIIRDLVPINTIGGWTYYGTSQNSTEYFFAIEHNPSGGNSVSFTPNISTYELINDGVGNQYFSAKDAPEGNFMLGNFWNLDLGTTELNGPINIRFFINPQRLSELSAVAQAYKESQGTPYRSNLIWIRTFDQFMNISEQINAKGLDVPILPMPLPTSGTYNSQNYLQFNNLEINEYLTGGGGSIRVLKELGTQFEYPSNPVGGMLIYNSDTGKIQGYTGTQWVDLN